LYGKYSACPSLDSEFISIKPQSRETGYEHHAIGGHSILAFFNLLRSTLPKIKDVRPEKNNERKEERKK
jgi:hypothetical protein